MRIALVNDMGLCLEAMRRVIAGMPGQSVAWMAKDGREAVEHCAKDTPDLILMDLIMPVMDGAEATRQIMLHNPCPILVVTASVVGNAEKVYEAMGNGALDAVRTPELGPQGSLDGAAQLLAKIQRVGLLSGKLTVRETRSGLSRDIPHAPDHKPHHPPLLVIGSSTGGPQALAEILSALPKPFPAAVGIVQHVNPEFAQGLAEWLTARTGMPTKTAQEGDGFEAGKILLAASDDHLVVDNVGRTHYTPHPKGTPYRPSVDIFFKSIADKWTHPCVAVLLTGMGRDGAVGLKALRDKGWATIAQGPKTSVVYGMPKAAAEMGAAAEILELGAIAPAVAGFFKAVKI